LCRLTMFILSSPLRSEVAVRLALVLTTFTPDHWLTFGVAGISNDKLVLESLRGYQFPSPVKGILESIGFSLNGYWHEYSSTSVCDLYAVAVFAICMR
jgi:hypothetical protein